MRKFTGEIKTSRAVLICMITAVIAAGTFYFTNLAYAIWVLPIPLLYFLGGKNSLKKTIGLTSSFVFTFYFVSYFVGFTIDVDFSPLVMFLLDLALIIAGSLLQGIPQVIAIVIGAKLQLPIWCRSIAIAALWTLAEWLTTIGVFAFPVRVLAITQWEFPVLIAGSSVFGILFISFLIMLFAGLIAQFLRREGKKNGKGFLIAGLLVFVVNLSFGIVYLQIDHQPSGNMKIAAVQHNVIDPENSMQRVEIAVELVNKTLENDETDVIVMPESTAQFLKANEEMIDALSALAVSKEADIIVGGVNDPFWAMDLTDSNSNDDSNDSNEGSGLVSLGENRAEDRYYENSVFLINKNGELEDDYYVKQKLVPFFENGTIAPFTFFLGDERGVFNTSSGKAGIIICFESVLPETVRDTVREGAEIIIEPGNDTYLGDEIKRMHFSQMIFRSFETGRTIVQSTTNGITGAVSPDGKTIRIPVGVEEVMVIDADLFNHKTPYLLIGETWIFVLAALCVLYGIFIRIKRKSDGN